MSVRLRVRRHGDVEHLDLRVGEQVVDGRVDRGDGVAVGDGLGGGRVARAMATGLNPAWRYATRWQSRMMKPAPTQPMRQSLRRGRRGR